MSKLPNAGACPDWHRDENGNAPCGACGQWVKPYRLVDVRQHLIKSLQAFAFLCDGCQRRLANPGRFDSHRPVKLSAFVRGMPGSDATRLAHEIRTKAKADPKADTRL